MKHIVNIIETEILLMELLTIYIHIRLDNNMIPFNIHTNKVIICTSDFITT